MLPVGTDNPQVSLIKVVDGETINYVERIIIKKFIVKYSNCKLKRRIQDITLPTP